MAETHPVARLRVFSLGFLTGFFALTLLLALIVIALADGWWRFLLLVLPIVFAAAMIAEFRRSARSPDEQIRT
ncbi:MAG TPA: hypothetical protein VFK17_09350 [Gaiellaceae bacterium]|jgi:cytochrome c biogenesis protein CcdA|nr:hypothetical protein [Gaiellaceae bacterium]